MSVIPEVGHGVVLLQNRKVEVREYPLKAPGKDEVLIKTVRTLISAGTELGYRDMTDALEYTPGYSNVGEIIAVGPHDGECEFKEGDLVVSTGRHGTYVIAGTKPYQLVHVPSNVSAEEAAFTILGSVSIHGVHKANVELGQNVLVSGMGLVGQMALQMLGHCGCETLTALDFIPARLDMALESGATHVVNPKEQDPAEFINDLTDGHGVDVIVESSGFPEAMVTAINLSRIGGRIMGLGSAWGRSVEMNFTSLLDKEITITGCHQPKCPNHDSSYYRWTKRHNRQQILRMIGDGRLDMERLISHRVAFDKVEDAYATLWADKNKVLGVILEYTEI